MYNFAKLLTEEPEKLERLIILFLKFLLTLWVTLTLFGVDITLKEIFNEEVFSNHALTSILFISFSFICVWVGIWLIAVESIIRLLVDLLSLIGKPGFYLKGILVIRGVITKDNKPKSKVIDFADELDEMATTNDNEYNDNSIRLFQYFSIALITYIIFIFSDEIVFNCITNTILIIVLLSMFIALIATNNIAIYFDTSLLNLRKRFRKMAYFQMIKNALGSVSNYDYNIDARIRRIILEKKDENFPYPPIVLTPVYSWNYNLDNKKMIDDLKRGLKNTSNEDIKKKIKDSPIYHVIVTNIKPDAVRDFISKLDMSIFIYAETREDIENGIEEMFYKINNENHERLSKDVESQKNS